jgi:hypothetical protein
MDFWLLFTIPLVAPAARLGMMIKFALLPSTPLSASELDRATNRAVILALAGFSFSALLALAVLDAKRVAGLQDAIKLLLSSFLAFYSSLNLQSYKARRWEDQLATGLKEAASGWLLFSVVAVVSSSPSSENFKFIVAGSTLLVWLIDLGIRLRLDYFYLRETEKN